MEIVASDFHFGDGSSRDDYVQHPDRLDRLEAEVMDLLDLRRQDQEVEFLILGDIANGEYGAENCLNAPSTKRGLQLLGLLNPWLLPGNHDSFIWQHKDHPALRPFRIADHVVHRNRLFWHGHQLDLFNSHNGNLGWIGRIVSRAAALIGLVSPSFEDRLRAMGGRDCSHEAFQRLAIKEANRQGVSGIVCGHTHEQQKAGPQYWNCGLWSRDGWLRID